MWSLSQRHCIPSVHLRNKRFISKELRKRGITIRPDSGFTVRLPPGSLATKKEVVVSLKLTLKASFLPLVVCDHILKCVKVIKMHPEKLSRRLDNGRQVAARINDGEKMT